MTFEEVIKAATRDFDAILKLPISRVIECSKTNKGWHVLIEAIERKAIPDTQDILGVYEVVINQQGEMVRYERVQVRRRADMESREENL